MNTEERFLSLLDDVMNMVRKHNMSDRKGQMLFEAAMQDIGTWRVTAVTEAAIRALIESDFDKTLVCRAHRISRREVFVALRDSVPRSEAFAYFVANDETTLALKKVENGRDGTEHWSPSRSWPETVGDICAKGGVGFGFTKPQKTAFIAAFSN